MILANVIQDAFAPLIALFQSILVAIYNVIGSWGWSIIALTILIRLLMLPLTIKQFEGMARMQQHMPELKQIQERYKEDKQRQQEEMMKFYRENKINPFASCLPLVLQLPVLVSLFYMLRVSLKKDICGPQLKQYLHLHGMAYTDANIAKVPCNTAAPGSAKFLFIPDLTAQAVGWVLVTLIILYVGSQLVSSLLTSVNADRNQRLIALGLPFFFTFFIIRFPAGLVVYWITTNLATIAQGFIVRRRVGPIKPATAGGGGGKGIGGLLGGKGGGSSPSNGSGGEAEAAAAVQSAAPPPPSPRKKKKRSGRRR
jgi:YidC/Oxa1 family membrane protein insertase